jgi:hypothetical protein
MAGKTQTGARLTAPMVGTAAAMEIRDRTAVKAGGGSCRVQCSGSQEREREREISEEIN